MASRWPISLLVGIAFVAGACAPATSVPMEGPRAPATEFPPYEQFDPANFDVEDPERTAATAEIVHDVPPEVMAGSLPASPERPSARRTVEGYRIQIFSTDDRRVAEQFAVQARSWWDQARPAAPDAIRQPDIIVDYQRPYYRVRFAAFASRMQAEDALGFVQRRFSDAFIVPDRVTVID